MSKRRRVLVIEPHSDDGAISTGGYLLKHRDIFEYYFLLAVASDFPLHHQEVMTRTTRLAEFSMYCDYLGASWVKPVSGAHQMPLDQDSRLDQFSRKDLVALIENGIQEVEPEILFLTGPSFHHDHTAVYEATIAALRPTARFCPDEVYVSENPTYVHQGNPMVRFHPDTYCTLTDAQCSNCVFLLRFGVTTTVCHLGALGVGRAIEVSRRGPPTRRPSRLFFDAFRLSVHTA